MCHHPLLSNDSLRFHETEPDDTRRDRRQELKDGIAQFYDESSEIWEEIWGEHMHHGYYYTGKERDHQKAQVRWVGYRWMDEMDGWMDVGGKNGSRHH